MAKYIKDEDMGDFLLEDDDTSIASTIEYDDEYDDEEQFMEIVNGYEDSM